MDEYSIHSLLQPGEYILWEGAPVGGVRLQKSDAFMIPFSVLWCGFAIFWTVSNIQSPAIPWFFTLFGLVFVGVGFYITVGRFFTQAHRWERLSYAVTDKRVILLERGNMEFMLFHQIPSLRKEVRKDGSGTIWFQPPTYYGHGKHRRRVPGVGFEEIPDAERVYRIIEGKMLEQA